VGLEEVEYLKGILGLEDLFDGSSTCFWHIVLNWRRWDGGSLLFVPRRCNGVLKNLIKW